MGRLATKSRPITIGRLVNYAKWRISEAYGRVRYAAVYDRREPNKVWEVYTLVGLFEQFPIDCVFDVGGNRGQYARMLRHDVGYRGLIISFEPVPELAEHMRRQARRDPMWVVEEVALSDRDGTASYNVMANDEFSSLLNPSEAHTREFVSMNRVLQSITVQTERLDTAYSRVQSMHRFTYPFLKMDTQGNDTRIIAAAPGATRNFVALQSELSFVPIYGASVDFNAALKLYGDAGFKLSALIQNNAGHFPDLIECDCLMVRTDLTPRTAGLQATPTHQPKP